MQELDDHLSFGPQDMQELNDLSFGAQDMQEPDDFLSFGP